MTTLAGFWNAHVHFFERKWADAATIPADELQAQLDDFTRFGFTTVFDLSSDLANTNALRARIESGEVLGPRILTTGPGLLPPGAVPSDIVSRMMGLMRVTMPMVSAPSSALRAVEENVAAGADAIKLFASGNAPDTAMDTAVMQAAVERAHALRKPVFVHTNTADDIEKALGCGADIIAHTTPRTPWTERTRAAIRSSNAALIPTLNLWNDFARHDRLSAQRQTNEQSQNQLRDWIACGRYVLFGTDYGAVGADPRAEYELMHRAGMTADDIVRSLTSAPAARFGVALNDAVVVEGDPSQEIGALANVRSVVRDGVQIYKV